MKFKGFYYDMLFISLLIFGGVLFIGVTLLMFDIKVAAVEAVILGVIILIGFIRMFSARHRYRRMLSLASKKLDYTDNKVLSNMPYPVSVCDDDGVIRWANERFLELTDDNLSQVSSIADYLGNEYDAEFNNYVKIKDRYYLVNTVEFNRDGTRFTAYKFIDNTQLKETEFNYIMSRPYIIIFQTDNIEDNILLSRDSEKSELKSKVDGIIDSWSDSFNSFNKKISDDRLLIVTEKENIDKMIEDGFSVLEKVRNCTYKEKNMQVTLSAGIACGDNLKSAEKSARKALDTAINRGGDQAALLLPDGNFRFFGAVSKSADKRNKIKIKLWASQLSDEIKAASNIFVCGHKSADYDSIGAALGVAYACQALGKNMNIIYNPSISLAGKLVDSLEGSGFENLIISEESALKLLDRNSLLVLTDTHVPEICDAPSVFSQAARKVIIDHHRLVPGAQTDKYVFIHNPNASSASEIVAEMLQHISEVDRIPEVIASALLSGIMLDTKDFVLRTGVSTFETAAYLKSCGADTVRVSRFFSNDSDTGREINKTVYKSETFKDIFAVSSVENESPNSRLVASKSADEMLNISGIKASFVFFTDNEKTCISARSLGDVNVQLIMEELGGGGHQTMAACQMKNTGTQEAKDKLFEVLSKTIAKEN